MVGKLTLNSLATALVNIPAVSMPFTRSLKTSDICGIVLYCVIKLHILGWPFIVPRTRCTCVMIMLINPLLDMPHLSGYLGKEEMLTNRDIN